MKAYGLPRNNDVAGPDLADIHNYGLKSSKSRCKGKGGDIRNSFRSSRLKRATRRIWKKRERAKNGAALNSIKEPLWLSIT